jgi:hypothetical protein
MNFHEGILVYMIQRIRRQGGWGIAAYSLPDDDPQNGLDEQIGEQLSQFNVFAPFR